MSIVATETAVAPAIFTLNSPTVILLPNVRYGSPDSATVSITNSATAPAADLDVAGMAVGDVKVVGSIADLQAGSTDASSISIVLDTGASGTNYGEVLLSPVSDLGNGNTVALAGTVIDVFGEVFAPAEPAVYAAGPLSGGGLFPGSAEGIALYTRVGAPGTVAVPVTNVAPEGYGEALIAKLTGTTSGIGIGNAGPTGDIAPGSTDQSLTLTYSTAQAGIIAGTATLAATSDGGTGPGSIDGLGTLALTPLDVPVNITVDNLAQLAIDYNSTLVSGGTLDLGTIPVDGQEMAFLNFYVLNAATGQADLLAGAVDFSGGGGAFGFNPGTFYGLDAGTSRGFTLDFEADQSGTFVGTLTVTAESVLPDDTDPVALPTRTLVVEANTYGDNFGCFLAGTQIETPAGMVAVEALRVGDLVCTAAGDPRPVTWIGQRLVGRAAAEALAPMRIRRGAFGRNQPCRDLLLSPDHAVFAESVLIPVRCLVDGVRIVRTPMPQAHYFHIELDRHDIVLAEGLPVESYLDAGSRSAFCGGKVTALAPDFASRTWEAQGCAPLRLVGPEVDAVRARLAAAPVRRRRRAA